MFLGCFSIALYAAQDKFQNPIRNFTPLVLTMGQLSYSGSLQMVVPGLFAARISQNLLVQVHPIPAFKLSDFYR